MLFDWEQSGWVGKLTHFESTNNQPIFCQPVVHLPPQKKMTNRKGKATGTKAQHGGIPKIDEN